MSGLCCRKKFENRGQDGTGNTRGLGAVKTSDTKPGPEGLAPTGKGATTSRPTCPADQVVSTPAPAIVGLAPQSRGFGMTWPPCGAAISRTPNRAVQSLTGHQSPRSAADKIRRRLGETAPSTMRVEDVAWRRNRFPIIYSAARNYMMSKICMIIAEWGKEHLAFFGSGRLAMTGGPNSRADGS